jgi:hypothetical protein
MTGIGKRIGTAGAIVACMRKILITLNAMLKNNTCRRET